MGVTVAEELRVSPYALKKEGAFNARLDADNPYFIDIRLLIHAKTPELKLAMQQVDAYFLKLAEVLASSKSRGDLYWQAAESLFDFHEVKGLCLGYSKKSTSGSGMSNHFRQQVLDSADIYVKAGFKDPLILEFLVLLTEGVGADRMSDMLGNVIYGALLRYTERVFKRIGGQTVTWTIGEHQYQLPNNPFNGQPIVLVPTEVLSDLPTASRRSDIDDICELNAELRRFFNRRLGKNWQNELSKGIFRRELVERPELLRAALRTYLELRPKAYDFEKDPRRRHELTDAAIAFVQENPLDISLEVNPTPEAVLNVVLEICEAVKDFIENHRGSHLIANENNTPKKEKAAQLVFHAIAIQHCRHADIGISPETDAGRGSVDFKFNKGFKETVVVELKLSSNKDLLHGYEVQVSTYAVVERTKQMVYYVIDFGDRPAAVAKLREVYLAASKAGDSPSLFVVDGRRKASASKA